MFTFKTEKATGRYRSFFNDQYLIKIKRKEVGLIVQNKDYSYSPKFTVKDNSRHCGWRWITLKMSRNTVDEVKKALKESFDTITTKYELHPLES